MSETFNGERQEGKEQTADQVDELLRRLEALHEQRKECDADILKRSEQVLDTEVSAFRQAEFARLVLPLIEQERLLTKELRTSLDAFYAKEVLETKDVGEGRYRIEVSYVDREGNIEERCAGRLSVYEGDIMESPLMKKSVRSSIAMEGLHNFGSKRLDVSSVGMGRVDYRVVKDDDEGTEALHGTTWIDRSGHIA